MNRTKAWTKRKTAATQPAVGGKDKDNRGRTRPGVMGAREAEEGGGEGAAIDDNDHEGGVGGGY